MLTQAFTLTTCLLVVGISAWLVRLALDVKGRTALNISLLGLYAAAALLGAVMFSRDIAGRWIPLGAAPAVMGMLQLLGVMFSNALYLAPVSLAPLLFPKAFGLYPVSKSKES